MKLATLCYVRSNGKTLMLHRIKKRNDMHAGKWNGLGGKLDPGETPEECVIREVREESGLELIAPALRGVLTFPAFSQDEDWYAFVFVADRFTGELIDSAEGVLAWVDDDKLAQLNLWEGDRIFLPWLDGPGFFSAKFVYQEGRLVDHHAVFHGVKDAEPVGQPGPAPAPFTPVYTPEDDTICWVCRGPVVKRHCKIICQVCGFTRDCSDP
jgi:8-oxo-dGTP diphosphatase